MKITLKLEDKEILLETHSVGNVTLYKAQDLLSGYGLNVEDSKNIMRNWQKVMKRKGFQKGAFLVMCKLMDATAAHT